MSQSNLPEEKLHFITAFANQADAYLALLDQEREFIEECFKAHITSGKIRHKSLPKASLADIIGSFTEAGNSVALFHFAGHAGNRTLNFEDAPANAAGLANFMRGQGCVPLVFLNGCSTNEQVVFFKEAGVGAVVSTIVDILDDHAVYFAKLFYHSFLVLERSIEESFTAAKNALIVNDDWGFSESDFMVRHFRDPLTTKPKGRQRKQHRGIWTLEVFDTNVSALKIGELSSFINRRRLVKPYCDWLVRQHARIKMTGLEGAAAIDLEKVFVSLQGGLSKTFEIYQTQKQLDEKIKILEQKFADNKLSDAEKQRQKSHLLGRIMPTVEERDKRVKSGKAQDGQTLNLLDAFLKYDKLVVLGDPGTGKTTLAKWLVLMFAKAMREERYVDELRVPLSLLSSGEGSAADGSFKFLRLPILLRVSDYSLALRKDQSLTLDRFLGYQGWTGEFPSFAPSEHGKANQRLDPAALNLLMLDYINKGEAMIILDGLDEITDEVARKNVVINITDFIFKTVDKPAKYGHSTNNKLIVTSRIAGYHLNALLHEEIYHLTIQPMDDQAIRNFTHTWMKAAQMQLFAASKKILQIEFDAREYAQLLCGHIFDPKSSGVRDLAGNPLLLTELGKMYLRENDLPDTRVELYEKTAQNMLDIWKARMFQQFSGNMSVFEEKIFFVLEDIAAYIHESYPTGLIRREEVESLVSDSLDTFYKRNPEIARTQTVKAEKLSFLKVLSDEVGLLAARATDLFGFLHLTFEEFFAAKKLLRDADNINQEILSKAYDPRWREPLILAISYMGKMISGELERKVLLQALLDAKDSMGNMVPRSANLIALAIPEMNYTPDKYLLHDVLLKLIQAYAQAGAFEEGEALRHNVEETFRALKKNEKIWQEIMRGLINIVRNDAYGPDLKNAVAFLIDQLEEYDKLMIEALVDARKYDLESWQWPIHKIVQFVAERKSSWIGFNGLTMRKFLFDFSDHEQIIASDQDWLQIFCLLFGGLVAVTNGENLTYTFSQEGIIFESSLAGDIMDLLENGSPARDLTQICELIWQDLAQPVEVRLDAFLILALFNKDFLSERRRKDLQTDVAFFSAAATRIKRTIYLFEKPTSILIKKTLESVQSVFDKYNDEETYHLINALFKVDFSYNKTITNPIVWVSAAPESLKAQFLAEVWVRPFTSDDAPYNLSVTLDTAGAVITRLGLETIAKSLVYVQDVTVLPPYERWRIERSPYMPLAEEDILEKALFNLLALSSDFDFFKLWGLSTLQPLWTKYPSLQDVSKLFLYDIKSQNIGKAAFDLLYQAAELAKHDDDGLEKHVRSSDRLFMIIYATQTKVLRGTTKLRSATALKRGAIDTGKVLAELFDVLSLVKDNSFFHAETQDTAFITDSLNEAEMLIPYLSTPQQQIRSYLKLATFYKEGSRQSSLVHRCIMMAQKITNPFVQAQSLRDIYPWTLEDPVIGSEWRSVRSSIMDDPYGSMVENRLYPQVKSIPPDQGGDLPPAITKIGALLKDLQQLFALPVDTEELWERLRFSGPELIGEIITQLYKIGIKKRFNLTMRGALGINFLIKNGHQSFVRQLIPCVEFPTHESLPFVRDWLDNEDQEIALFAALLLLETGILTERSFQYLTSTLFGETFKFQDQIRNRINLAINGKLFYASQIGVNGLIAIERTVLENWEYRPYLVRGVAWLFEYLVFDDSDLLLDLIEEAKRKGRRAVWASAIIANIHLINSKTFKTYLHCLKDPENDLETRKKLLRSGVFLLYHLITQAITDKLLAEFREILCLFTKNEDPDVRLYAIDTLGFLTKIEDKERKLLRQIAKMKEAEVSPMALISLGRVDFERSENFITSLLESNDAGMVDAAAEAVARNIMLTRSNAKEALALISDKLKNNEILMLKAILAAAKDRWYGQYAKNCVAVMGEYFDQYPARYLEFLGHIHVHLPLLTPVRKDSSYAQSVRWMERAMNLEALAAGAERLPSTYYNGTEGIRDIEHHLVTIVLKDGIFTNRMNALTCLSLRREMTHTCTLAFCAALKDISEVQTTAISVMFRFWEASQEFIDHVSELLDSESYSSRYAVISMLAAIGKYNKSETKIRQRILEILYTKMNLPEFKVPVFLLRKKITINELADGSKVESEDGNVIEYKGRLDRLIYKRILEVAGISAIED